MFRAVLLVSLFAFCAAMAQTSDFTVIVPAGKRDCFFFPVKKSTLLELEYQVVEGGDNDIDFFLQAPDGKVLISEHRTTDEYHEVNASDVGDYKLCFDNTFSHFSSKTVFFDISTDYEDDDDEDVETWEGAKDELQDIVDMTLQDFKKKIDTMKRNLDKANGLQNTIKMFEARDRNIMESNFSRVNFFSAAQLALMIVIALTQVIMIRSLFDDSSRLHGVMKTRT